MKEAMRLFRKVCLLLPIVVVMVGFNYFIDPANIFKNAKYYKEIADILLRGENVVNLVNFDEKLLKKYYAYGLSEKTDILVLGSSRVMLLTADMFPGKSFYNSSVSSATLEDDMSLYWMFRKKELLPKTLIIGLDPWLLNASSVHTSARQSLAQEYQEILVYSEESVGKRRPSIFSSKYFELFLPSYFQTSFKFWLNNLGKDKNEWAFYPTSQNVTDEIMRRVDGSINYGINYRNASVDEVYVRALDFVRNPSMLNSFHYLDPDLIKRFEKFIDLIKKDKVEIVFYLSPYHPVVYDSLVKSEKFKMIIEAQKYFEMYAKSKDIQLLGSYNPADIGLGEDDFYDGMHQDAESIRKIFLKKISANN